MQALPSVSAREATLLAPVILPALQPFLTCDHGLISPYLILRSHDNYDCGVIELRTAGAPEHLHYLQVGILLDPRGTPSNSILDDGEMTWEVNTHRKCGGAADDIQYSFQKSGLNADPIIRIKSRMVESYSSSSAF